MQYIYGIRQTEKKILPENFSIENLKIKPYMKNWLITIDTRIYIEGKKERTQEKTLQDIAAYNVAKYAASKSNVKVLFKFLKD